MRDDPLSLQPLSQSANIGLPRDILYQPGVVGGSHAIPEKRRDDYWDELEDEARDVTPVGGSLRQALNDFPVIVGSVSTQILQYNPRRTYFSIQNKGATPVFIAYGRAATLGSQRIDAGAFYEPILGTVSSVHVVSATGGEALTVVEGIRVT